MKYTFSIIICLLFQSFFFGQKLENRTDVNFHLKFDKEELKSGEIIF